MKRLEGCLEVESYAGRIRVHESETIPSLLQLGQYAQGRHAVSWKRVRLQQARFEMVKRRAAEGVSFDFVLAENVLVRPVGGPRLMADQLRTLNEAGRLANVSVRVVPAGLCGRLELDVSGFEIVDVPDAASIVFGYRSSVGWQMKEPDRHVRYAAAYEAATDKALSPADSRELVAELAWMFSRQARPGRVLTLVPRV